jgi:serine protease Do
MTLQGFTRSLILSHLSALLLCGAQWVAAQDSLVREAATATGPAGVSARVDDSQRRARPARNGLAPTPNKPERVEPPQPGEVKGPAGLPDVRAVVRKVNRSVVSIRMLDGGSSWSLGEFAGGKGEPEGKAMGYGAGFVVSEAGHVLTNEHVLRNGSRIEVELLDGRKCIAKTLHKDAKNDLALLKIDVPGGRLEPVEMGNSDEVELGEWVIGIGNPYGIGQSLMIGIVSAKDRKIPGSGYPPLIQIDAAMNLGNSGGPLFNMAGRVVGINTILLWKSQGIGFATPVNVARLFLKRGSALAQSQSAHPPTKSGFGQASGTVRPVSEGFNPLAPPWKYAR